MAKKKSGIVRLLLWVLLFIVIIIDIVLTLFGIVPGLGDITASTGNFVLEIIQFALIIGLIGGRK